MDISSKSLPSQLMLSSGRVAFVAKTFLPRIGVELFENAAKLTPIKVPSKWPLPPHIIIGEYSRDRSRFVANGDKFVDEKVFWRSVLSYIIEDDLLMKEFDNIKRPFVKLGESEADGAFSRGTGNDLKLMAILEAKTPGSETAHPDKKVCPHLSPL